MTEAEWHQTACILCECNCGIEVRLGGEDGRRFERIRGDQMLRRFLGPRILQSLYVLRDPRSLPLFEGLLVAGHTDADVDRCEVTRALVALRQLTGRVAPSSTPRMSSCYARSATVARRPTLATNG